MKSISVSELKISPLNIRTLTKKGKTEELEQIKQSIKTIGIIEPLIVRKTDKQKEIVVGQRRFLASKQLRLKEVPCIVKKLSDQEAIEYSLIENLQRIDVDRIDLAEGLKKDVDFILNSSDWSKTKIVEEILPKKDKRMDKNGDTET